jgi:hypothetical protein
VEAFETGDYQAAYPVFLSLAEQGDAAASYNLGLMFDHGLGVGQDQTAAVFWYGRAAEAGDVEAAMLIGDLALEGYWGQPDFSLAATWFRFAAEQGHAQAQRKLAMLYVTGRGVDADAGAAARWFRLAAEQGDAEAARWLADFDTSSSEGSDRPILLPKIATAEQCRRGFPDVSFEVGAEVEFDPAPLNRELGSEQLGERFSHGPHERVLGLTETGLEFRTQIQYLSIPLDEGYCFFIKGIDVTLLHGATEVFVASEYGPDSCAYGVILEHEQEHVRVARDTLHRFLPQVRSALTSPRIPTALSPLVVDSPRDAQAELGMVSDQLLKPVFERMHAEIRRSQARLDTPDEYRRLREQCNLW